MLAAAVSAFSIGQITASRLTQEDARARQAEAEQDGVAKSIAWSDGALRNGRIPLWTRGPNWVGSLTD